MRSMNTHQKGTIETEKDKENKKSVWRNEYRCSARQGQHI